MRPALLVLSLLLAADAHGQVVFRAAGVNPAALSLRRRSASPGRRPGALRIEVDDAAAYPGGVLAVRLRSPRPLGPTYAILEGRRFPFFYSRGALRALVPVGVGTPAGSATLGIEIRGARGRRRLPVGVRVSPRSYPARIRVLPEADRALLALPNRTRDSRVLLQALRTISRSPAWSGTFQPPVTVPGGSSGFGGGSSYVGGSPVEEMVDSIHGEYHRGLDFAVPEGTPVVAPAAGTVLLARPLALSGLTVVIDHGQGVISALYHLSTLNVGEGRWIEAGDRVGRSGASGLAIGPHLHWGVYVHTVAVDPEAFAKLAK